MEMDTNQKKEQFSKAYVSAISAQSGLRADPISVDDDSIDLIIRGRNFSGQFRNPQIDIQLKCTASDIGDENNLKFTLPIKNYNDLRGNNIINPRYLFVLIVPNDCKDWLIHFDDFSTIKHCCYYYSLLNHPTTQNKKNITLTIPRKQKLTSVSMLELLTFASDGKSIGAKT
ncbi:DUF4365 domain-containing protein [Acinetobacter pragensis]|uniref:DUF4365 domain-containing protein n=1 Tax=Acinetobacter pragensis TaxID=1806892 RepID=UPI0033403620